VTTRLEVNSNAAIRVAVESGLAPAVLSYLAVDGEVRTGRLVELPVVDLALDRPLRAVWRRRNRLTQLGADLITIATSIEASKANPRGGR
jgi:DNA-binding transcriptional LysR family regulator